VKPGDR